MQNSLHWGWGGLASRQCHREGEEKQRHTRRGASERTHGECRHDQCDGCEGERERGCCEDPRIENDTHEDILLMLLALKWDCKWYLNLWIFASHAFFFFFFLFSSVVTASAVSHACHLQVKQDATSNLIIVFVLTSVENNLKLPFYFLPKMITMHEMKFKWMQSLSIPRQCVRVRYNFLHCCEWE